LQEIIILNLFTFYKRRHLKKSTPTKKAASFNHSTTINPITDLETTYEQIGPKMALNTAHDHSFVSNILGGIYYYFLFFFVFFLVLLKQFI